MQRLALGLLIYCMAHAASAQPCSLSFRGSVYENAPEDTKAGDITTAPSAVVGVNIILSLDPTFDKYFKLNGTDILVKSPTELDRSEVGISGANAVNINGEVICNTIPLVTDIVTTGTIQMIYTNKEPPAITSPTTWEQSEYTPATSIVATLTATDGDNTGRDVLFYVEQSEYVAVDQNSGELTLVKELDYENAKEVSFTLIAQDSGYNSFGDVFSRNATEVFTMDVIDYDDTPPLFQPCNCISPLYTANVTVQMTGPLTDVQPGPIQAIDGDTDQNVAIVYEFIGGSPDYEEYFVIDANLGTVSILKAIPEDGSFTMGIRAMQVNNENRYSIAYLQVDVYAQDDAKPQISAGGADLSDTYVNDDGSEQLYVKDVAGSRIKLNATDSDGGTLIFTINPPDVFHVLSNGYIFASRSDLYGSARATVQQSYILSAINIDVSINSPNRVSDPYPLDVTISEMTTAATTESTTFITTTGLTGKTANFPVTKSQETAEPTALDTTKGNVVEEMVPKSTLIAVAAGLSTALIITILITVFFVWKSLKKDSKVDEGDKETVIEKKSTEVPTGNKIWPKEHQIESDT